MRHGICWDNQKGKRAGQSRRRAAGGWYQCVLLFVGASLCMCSAYMQLLDVYPGLRPVEIPAAYKVYVLLLAAVLALVYGSGRLRFWWLRLLPALPAGWCFYQYYVRHRFPVEDGSLYLARFYAKELCRFFKISLIFPDGLAGEAPRAMLFWSLLLLCACFTLAGVFQAYWLLLLIPGAVLAAGIAVGKSPRWGSVLVLLAAGVVLAARWAVLPDRWYVRTVQLAGVLCVCILSGAVCAAVPQRVVGLHEDVQKKQLALEDAALALPVFGFFEPDGVVDNHSPNATGREVLTMWLSGEPTENIYLKDYAASRYENGRWMQEPEAFEAAALREGLDASTAGRELLSMAYETEDDFFNQKKEIDFLAGGGWSVASPLRRDYRITCRDFRTSAPLPYVSRLPEKLTMDADTAAKKPWNLKSYSGSLMMGGSADDPLTDYLELYYAVKQWSWFEGSFWNSISSSIYTEPARTRDDDWYSAFAWENYRPQSDNRVIEAFLYERCGDVHEMRAYYDDMMNSVYPEMYNNMPLSDALSIQFWLQNFGGYSLDLDPLPAGADPVDYFLGTSERGYCVHYASAATLILQSMGIPARYASGYVVFPGDFEKEKHADGYTAHVTDARAHAWVEIYLRGFGWLPIEVTPGFSGIEEPGSDAPQEERTGEEENGNAISDEEREENQDAPQEEEEETPEADEPQKDALHPQEQTTGSREMRRTLQVLAGLSAAVLCICVVIRLIRERERRRGAQIEKALREGCYNTAANQMNRRIYSRLKRRTAGIGVKDDESYRQALLKLDAGCDADLYIRLVKQAHFSDAQMRAEDAQALYEAYLAYREALRYGKSKAGRRKNGGSGAKAVKKGEGMTHGDK